MSAPCDASALRVHVPFLCLGPRAGGTQGGLLGLTYPTALADLDQRDTELLYPEGINHRVEGRVHVGHEDAGVQGELGHGPLRAEEVNAVHDVYWQPAHGKEKHHQRQRLGQLQLLPVVPLSVARGLSAPIKLPPDHPEDLGVQGDHDGQRHHHPAEEVEVHHVVHPHDRGEFADDVAGAAEVSSSVAPVPSHHRNQSGEEGEDPTQTNGHTRPPLGHYGAVPEQSCWNTQFCSLDA